MSGLTISMVSSAIDTKTRDVGIQEILNAIRSGGKRVKAQITQIRNRFEAELAVTGDRKKAKLAVDPLKKQLPGVTPSGRFKERKAEALIEYSRVVQADLDSLGEQLVEVRENLKQSPHLFVLFLSPTGDGLKAWFRVPADSAKHSASFRAVEKHVKELTGVQIDQACKDVARLCFMSYDPNLYVNENAVEITPFSEPKKSKASFKSDLNLSERQRIAVELLGDIDWQGETSGFAQCPGKHLHTTADGERDCQIDFDHVPTVHCFHDHCRGILDAINHELRSRIGKAEHVKPGEAPQWQDSQPLPEDLPVVPPFDYQCLPETLGLWIKDIAERMQCPPDFPAVGAMIALGSVLGRKIGIRPKRRDDWLELANLWGCIIARPGLLKTPALQQALVHLRRLVAKAYEKYKEACQNHDISDMLRAQRKKIVEDQIRNALKESAKKKNTAEKDQAEETAREMAEKHLKEANEKPVCRRYEVNDSTIPKLGELLAENPNGLLLVRDELSGLLRELDNEEHAGDRAKYLEMWDGKGELTYDRVGRGTVRIPSNTLSILGGIQPDVISPYVREAVRGGIGNDGLLQRLQVFVWPDVSKEWRNVDEWPDTEAKNQAFGVFEYLDKLTPEQVGADSSDGIPFLRFTDDAQELFDAWRAPLENKLRSGVEHPAFEAHLSKYRKLVPALALLIHLADRKSGRVSLSALSKALLWADYLEAHARRIYSVVLRPDTAAARELAKHLQRGDLSARFNLREVYRRGWAGLSDKEDAEAATEILCDSGWIRPAPDAPRRVPGTPGRSPSPIFEVNPLVFEPPLEATDTTDTINSGVSVSDLQGLSIKSEASNSAEPEISEHPSPPAAKADTIPEQKRIGWV